MNDLSKIRIGYGYDLHRLLAGEAEGIALGGILVKCDKKILAHSDGDVLLHAICDALLGAAQLGDIGKHFPDTDARWKDIPSIELLKLTNEMLRDNSYSIINLDCTIILESPMLYPYISKMQENINSVLNGKAVNIKATRGEGLDAIGKGEAVAAHCVCLIQQQS